MTDEEKKAYEFYRECNKNDLSSFEYFSEPSKEQIKYLETILNLIERLQKENKKLKNKLLDTMKGTEIIKEETPQYIKENYIPKEAIRNLLDEVESCKNIATSNPMISPVYIKELDYAIEILEELLGDE